MHSVDASSFCQKVLAMNFFVQAPQLMNVLDGLGILNPGGSPGNPAFYGNQELQVQQDHCGVLQVDQAGIKS